MIVLRSWYSLDLSPCKFDRISDIPTCVFHLLPKDFQSAWVQLNRKSKIFIVDPEKSESIHDNKNDNIGFNAKNNCEKFNVPFFYTNTENDNKYDEIGTNNHIIDNDNNNFDTFDNNDNSHGDANSLYINTGNVDNPDMYATTKDLAALAKEILT